MKPPAKLPWECRDCGWDTFADNKPPMCPHCLNKSLSPVVATQHAVQVEKDWLAGELEKAREEGEIMTEEQIQLRRKSSDK